MEQQHPEMGWYRCSVSGAASLDTDAARQESVAGRLPLQTSDVAQLVVDVWRIQRRARRDGTTPDGVHVACDTALERLAVLGFQLKEIVGEPYHEDLEAVVIHREGSERSAWIGECLSPAVYFADELIKPAVIVVQGETSRWSDRLLSSV